MISDPPTPERGLSSHELPPADTEALARLSSLGLSGRPIGIHRSIHRLDFPRARLAEMLLIPLAFNLLVWFGEPLLARFWTGIFEFWLPRLGVAGGVSQVAVPPFWFGLDLPVFNLPSHAPGPWAWWGSVVAATGLLWLSCHTSDRFMPLRYLLRFVVFIHVVALVYFAFYSASFPYTVPLYLESSFATGLWFMAVLPWVHGLVYHVFGFPLMNKVVLTLLSLLFLAVALPLQLLVHAFVLTRGSLLYLPVLHLVFGILPLIMGCIGLYGWAMSWRGPARRS